MPMARMIKKSNEKRPGTIKSYASRAAEIKDQKFQCVDIESTGHNNRVIDRDGNRAQHSQATETCSQANNHQPTSNNLGVSSDVGQKYRKGQMKGFDDRISKTLNISKLVVAVMDENASNADT